MYEIDLAEIKEPILCYPNDPDDAKPLSQVAGARIDDVFIGSCMTNIGNLPAAGKLPDKVEGGSLATRPWLAPPPRMDEHPLMEEGSPTNWPLPRIGPRSTRTRRMNGSTSILSGQRNRERDFRIRLLAF